MIRIIINLQYEATHCWKDCDIEEVSFLKNPHRHIFYICCKKIVEHKDRAIEIIQFKRQIEKYLQDTYHKDFGNMSCEMIAEQLMIDFELSYCSVLEDNENGAEIGR